MGKNFGDILYQLRDRGPVKFKAIFAGLCSESTFRRAESGERNIDYMLYNALLQRLGFSANKIEKILTLEEYTLMKERYLIKKTYGTEQFPEVEERIRQYRTKMHKKLAYNLHEQYLLKYHAMLLHVKYQDYKKSYRLLKQALLLTIPTFQTFFLNNLYLSREELDILFRMAISLIRQNQLIEAKNLLIELMDYIEKHILDEEEQFILYPMILYQCVLLLCHSNPDDSLTRATNLSHALFYCNKGIDLLRENCILQYQAELLSCQKYILRQLQEIYGFYPSHNRIDHQTVLQEQIKDIYDVAREHEYDYYFHQKIQDNIDAMKLVDLRPDQNIQLMGSLLQRKRKALDITQEKLCQNIITPKNLSRIEQGKQVPKENTWYALMNQLGVIQLNSYFPEIGTMDPMVWFKKRTVAKLIANKNYKKASALLDEIELSLTKENVQTMPRNKQYLSYNRSIVNLNLKQISIQQALKQMEQALRITIPEYDNISIFEWPFTKDEAVIINNIGILHTKLGDRKQAIELWLDVKKSFEYIIDEGIEENMYLWNMHSYLLVLTNLAGILDNTIEECYQSMQLADLGIQTSLDLGYNSLLANFLYAKVWSMEILIKEHHLEKDSLIACRKYCKQAISISSILGDQQMKEHLEKHLDTINPYLPLQKEGHTMG